MTPENFFDSNDTNTYHANNRASLMLGQTVFAGLKDIGVTGAELRGVSPHDFLCSLMDSGIPLDDTEAIAKHLTGEDYRHPVKIIENLANQPATPGLATEEDLQRMGRIASQSTQTVNVSI